MTQYLALVCALLAAGAAQAQRQRVYLSDKIFENAGPVGPEFLAALKRELARSSVYELTSVRDAPQRGILFHLHIVVNCQFDDCERDRKAMAFAEIDTLGRTAWPLPDQWYSKMFVVRRGHVDQAARTLLGDVAAVWCGMSHYNSAAAMTACPKELLPPWPPGFP
ncbi:MAG TPA: hypothetical protein VMH81_26520 [Bryobacteraceae bacterium]|nr:hypothetical protein [Bryobacteraceae bacterium]